MSYPDLWEEKQLGTMLSHLVDAAIHSKVAKLVNKTNLKLNKQPYVPNNYELKEIGKLFPPNFLHKSWNDFLYWDSELEP